MPITEIISNHAENVTTKANKNLLVLNKLLEALQLEPFEKDNNNKYILRREILDSIPKAIDNLIGSEGSDASQRLKFQSSIREFIGTSYTISNEALSFIEHDYNNQFVELNYLDNKSKSERKQAWILWIQKLIRWIVGSLLAVLIYSFVVWASEKWTFIKIPIKHTFGFQNGKVTLTQPPKETITNSNGSALKLNNTDSNQAAKKTSTSTPHSEAEVTPQDPQKDSLKKKNTNDKTNGSDESI